MNLISKKKLKKNQKKKKNQKNFLFSEINYFTIK
jgi:hypothetical protein